MTIVTARTIRFTGLPVPAFSRRRTCHDDNDDDDDDEDGTAASSIVLLRPDDDDCSIKLSRLSYPWNEHPYMGQVTIELTRRQVKIQRLDSPDRFSFEIFL